MVLRQGINRQVRRMFEALGYHVKDLVRIRIDSLRLGNLPRGHWRALTQFELKTLRRRSDIVAAGADRGRRKADHTRERRGQRPRLPVA